MSNPNGRKGAEMSEADLLACVLDLAKLYGWRTAHFRPALTARGWRTAVSGDGKGFPDLILVRSIALAVELKAKGGKVSPEQVAWLEALEGAGVCAWLWTPEEWADGTIQRVLEWGS